MTSVGAGSQGRVVPRKPSVGVYIPPLAERRRRYLTAEHLEWLAFAPRATGRLAVLVLGLGHASAELTLNRYADLFDDDLEAVGAGLDVKAREARGPVADFCGLTAS